MNINDVIKLTLRDNTGAWFETHGRIWPKDRTGGLVKPRQNYLQKKLQQTVDRFEDLELPVRLILLKPRARGSTTYCMALGYTLMRRRSASAIFIGGQSDQTVGLWNMLKVYHQNDTFDWGNTGVVNEKGATFTNSSRAKKETAKDVQAGIGDTYQLLHATEVARWSKFGVANAADVLANLLKAVPLIPGSYIFLESTAEGGTGPFVERWTSAVDAEAFISGEVDIQPGQYVRCFAPWYEFTDSAIRLTPQQKGDIQRTIDAEEEYKGEKELIEMYGRDDIGTTRLGTAVDDFDVWEQLAWRRYAIHGECKRDPRNFDQDYPHSWQTAFIESGSLRFNQTGLNILVKRLTNRTPEYGVLEDTKDKRLAWRQTEKNEARITIFEKPIPGGRYLEAVDVMTGATQTGGKDPDLHAPFIMRAGEWGKDGKWVRPATVARVIPCRWDIDVLELDVWRLARFYGPSNGCKIAIEMNMDRGLTELLKLRGADLYQREMFNQREFTLTKALGFQTNSKTREILIETLARAIREWDTPGSGIDVWCPHAVGELQKFVRTDSGRSEAAPGSHDDDVIAIALGLHLIEQATKYFPQTFRGASHPDLRQAQQEATMGGAAYS
jgi:hypothetical protein